MDVNLGSEDFQEDYYALLGVERDASPEQVIEAFRRAAKECHPDVGGDAERMRRLNRAREVLANPGAALAYREGRTSVEEVEPVVRHGGLMVETLRQFRHLYVDKAAYHQEDGIWYREEEGGPVPVGEELPPEAHGCPRPWDRKRLLWDEAWQWALQREGEGK